MPYRLDTGTIAKTEKSPEGFMRVWCNFSKVGPLRYLHGDGNIQIEHVTEDTLFNEDSLQTAAMKPLTLNHPKEGMVTPQNAMRLQRGFVGNTIIKNYPYATIVATVTDQDAIDSIERGDTTQISAGYRCKTRVRADGTLEQCDREYNHFALVEKGRAGADVALHLDAEDDLAVMVGEAELQEDEQSEDRGEPSSRTDAVRQMATIAFPSGRVFEVEDDELANSILGLIADLNEEDDEEEDNMQPWKQLGYDSADEAIDDLKSKLDSTEGKLAGIEAQVTELKTKLDSAESERMDADQIAAEVSMRADTWGLVLPFLRLDSPDFQPDYKLDVAEIQKLAIAKKLPDLKLDGRSREFVDGIWATIEPQLKQDSVTRPDSTLSLKEALDAAQRQDCDGMGMMTAKKKRADRILANSKKMMA